jgi:hypothetical protein
MRTIVSDVGKIGRTSSRISLSSTLLRNWANSSWKDSCSVLTSFILLGLVKENSVHYTRDMNGGRIYNGYYGLRNAGRYIPSAPRVINPIQQGVTPCGSEGTIFHCSPDSKQRAAHSTSMTR